MGLSRRQAAHLAAPPPYKIFESDGEFAFVCEHKKADCGTVTPQGWVPYITSGWPTKELAVERGLQHIREHETGDGMETLDAFREKHGITVTKAGKAVLA